LQFDPAKPQEEAMADDVIKLENVKIEREGGATFIILNRPEKRNAMSPQLHMDMVDALDWAEMDDQTKVVIITGAGGNSAPARTSSSISAARKTDPKRASRRVAPRMNGAGPPFELPKATIAMVHGYCFGGGFTAGHRLRFAIAADNATFGLSEVNWGVIPGGLVAWAVTNVMGYRDAIYYSSPATSSAARKRRR